ncbi:MAG: flagellar export chaperone FliS [Geothrix sp.]|nr:flagellar export chaperone FliS [Geothrix sp.]
MTPYAKATDHYLTQRVMGASPEQLAALLLEGAQRFLAQAEQAISRKDYAAKGQALNRVSAIVDELAVRLDMDQGGELAQNLLRLYDWWGREIVEAGAQLETPRLERVSRQMGDLRQTWEQHHLKRTGATGTMAFQAGDLVG